MRSDRPSRSSAILWFLLAIGVGGCTDGPLVPDHELRVQAAKPTAADPTVSSISPASAPQDTTLDVTVYGSNFDRGSRVALGISGSPSGDVVTNSTRYVSPRELRANITIAATATVGAYDVIVITSLGRKGIGTESFEVKKKTDDATLTTLSTLGSNSEVLAVNGTGTVVVGHSFDRAGYLYAVKWVLQNGSWVISKLPYTGSARALSISDDGSVAGYYASHPNHAVMWHSTGGSIALGCSTDTGQSNAQAISASGQLVVGWANSTAAVWQPGSCRVNLPPLIAGGGSTAFAINADGTIVGGSAHNSSDINHRVPVRWTRVSGQWQVAQLDVRRGRVTGINAAGNLVGFVRVPCSLADGCDRPIIWFAAGGSRELGNLGGDHLWATGINDANEVVGRGSPVNTAWGGVAFFWSESRGLIPLPAREPSGAGAWGVSQLRPDGTRLVVGTSGTAPYVWVVRDP